VEPLFKSPKVKIDVRGLNGAGQANRDDVFSGTERSPGITIDGGFKGDDSKGVQGAAGRLVCHPRSRKPDNCRRLQHRPRRRGIRNDGTLKVTNGTFSGNGAIEGGGILS